MRGGAAGGVVRAMLAATLVAALGACDASAPSAEPTARFTPEPTPVTTVYVLGSRVWYSGLVLTFDRVSATLDNRGGPVDVLVGLENPGTDAANLDAPITLVIGGTRAEPTRDSRIPEVPAGGSAATVLTFELQSVPSVAGAVIEVGSKPQHVALVPLTTDGGVLTAFEPVTLELTGAATAGSLKLAVKGGELRWDLPDWWQELDSGVQTLTVRYDVTYAGDFAGGFPFTGENVALRLPDGTEVEARRDGHSQSVELVGARKTKKGLFSRFEIPNGLTGKFALVVIDGSTRKTIAFTIGG